MRAVDLYAAALAGRPAVVRYEDGTARPLGAERWTGAPTAADSALLERCADTTLDVGCGPGRLLRGLRAAGVRCAGVDVASAAVALARDSGAAVLQASVFDRALDGTRWGSVVLADGNIGIGGDPVALLRRAAELVDPRGEVLVELDPPGTASRRVRVRLEDGPRTSDWFAWAHVGLQDAAPLAQAAGLVVREAGRVDGRCFAALAPSAGSALRSTVRADDAAALPLDLEGAAA